MEDLENEIWKDVLGYEGLYQVSNLGRVKCLGNGGSNRSKNRLIKPYVNSKGYEMIGLSKNNKQRLHPLHRLVISSFQYESDLQVNHKNGCKSDNRLENLEYVTNRDNKIHDIVKKKQGLIGAIWDKKRCVWVSRIWHNNKRLYLGTFDTELEAHEAYKKYALKLESDLKHL